MVGVLLTETSVQLQSFNVWLAKPEKSRGKSGTWHAVTKVATQAKEPHKKLVKDCYGYLLKYSRVGIESRVGVRAELLLGAVGLILVLTCYIIP